MSSDGKAESGLFFLAEPRHGSLPSDKTTGAERALLQDKGHRKDKAI